MKILRILSLAAAAAGLMTIGACKSPTPAPAPPIVDPGSYDTGK